MCDMCDFYFSFPCVRVCVEVTHLSSSCKVSESVCVCQSLEDVFHFIADILNIQPKWHVVSRRLNVSLVRVFLPKAQIQSFSTVGGRVETVNRFID